MNRLAKRLLLAQVLDAATFAAFFILVPVSVHMERNPLIAAMYALGGYALVGLVKVGIAAWIGYRANRPAGQSRFRVLRSFAIQHPNFHPRLAIVMLSIATASGIAGAGFNLASLIDSVH